VSRRPGTLLAILSLAAAPALAHQIRVFAFADGDRIEGSAYFAGGEAASGARIRVLDAQGGLLAELEPDGEGAFSLQARAPVDHLVVAETADGHRAEWRVRAAELGPGFKAPPAQPGGVPGDAAARPFAGPAADPGLESLIEQAVARQVRPLREELIAAQARAGVRDVLGGIGYILGVAGLLAWWRSRRPPGSR
jgi:nickel transport protein